ncbi:anhydro-N-acetylmuramic acid kinase [Paenalcaligenes niemegkensis]|uniref:anhydro-N-acetylmuramic acid kinase n=1 Tax=Paenalcaligenes niemegkensis TaxID=2895469 RepID=UPI001EE915C3|nr:anhydro-N-acetylmuramic acid kinase [Paenalcaligenes niemegkensis]MCQ9615414.1 anhydro-N-acetylmuramic acid kinase [Paenalcaligenes niemegkensis]
MDKDLYIGLMSGTSTDGADAVLASFAQPERPVVLGALAIPMPGSLRTRFLALNSPANNELESAYLAANELAELYADACNFLLRQCQLPASEVRAIGAHGQTVRHNPRLGYTVQLNAPALLAERTGIDVIADFRSRDLAAGGQGAPLVPFVHKGLFSSRHARVILNLGGIANISVLDPVGPLQGFDTGPANMLMDYWAQRHLGKNYDSNGEWASGGEVLPKLLEALLSERWFALPPPKSTGRDLFNASWLHQKLDSHAKGASPQDVQATLLALTVHSIARAMADYAPETADMLVCGGGALNAALMQGLEKELGIPVRSTQTVGVAPQEVEALAFAWLAYAHVKRIKASTPEITGARHASILGACYPA